MKAFRTDLVEFRKEDKAKDATLAHSVLSEASAVLVEVVNRNLLETTALLDEAISILQ